MITKVVLELYRFSSDILITLVLSVLFTMVRYSFQKNVQIFATEALGLVHTKSKKLSESCWKLFYYGNVWIWGISITLPEDFFWEPVLCIKDFPNLPMDVMTKSFYMTQLAFYIHSIGCHITIEVHRKDFLQMLIHHIITVHLLLMSYYTNTHRFGLIVLILHDINDVFLECGKIFIYLGKHKAADISFLALIGSWLVTRIVLFPTKVLYTSLILSYSIMIATQNFAFYCSINLLLLVVQGLDWMWFGMMLKILHSVLLNKKSHVTDSRESSESD